MIYRHRSVIIRFMGPEKDQILKEISFPLSELGDYDDARIQKIVTIEIVDSTDMILNALLPPWGTVE